MIEPLLIVEPDGESSPVEMVSAVRGAGYANGVVAARNGVPRVEGVRGPLTGAVVTGPYPGKGRDRVSGLRPGADLMLAEAAQGAAGFARDGRVDGLLGLAGDRFLDPRLLGAAADHGVALVFDFSSVIEGRNRFSVLKRFNANAETCRETGCPAMVTSGASSVYGVRGYRELLELAVLSGFTSEQAREALEHPGRLLEGRDG